MKRMFIVAAFVFTGIVRAETPDTVKIDNLAAAIKLAIQGNTDILNGTLDIESKRQRIMEAASEGLPQLKVSGKVLDNVEIPTSVFPAEALGGQPGSLYARQMGVNYNVDGGLNVRQLLFDPAYLIGLKAARSSAKLSELSLRKAKEEVVIELASAYYNALLSAKQAEYLKKQLVSYQSLLRVAEIQLKTGVTKKSDLGRLQVNQTNLETELENYENLTAQHINSLKLIVGIQSGTSLTMSDSISEAPLFPGSDEACDVHNRADWQILQLQETLKTLDIRRQQAGYLPVLAVGAQYNGDFYGTEFKPFGKDWYPSSSVYLTLDVPLFDGLKRKAQIAQARFESEKIRNEQSLLASTVGVEIQDAKMRLAYSISRLQGQKKNQELANEVYRESTVEYNSGTAPLSDLLNAETSLLESQRQYLGAMADKLLAEFSLQKAQGTLLQKFNLDGHD